MEEGEGNVWREECLEKRMLERRMLKRFRLGGRRGQVDVERSLDEPTHPSNPDEINVQ